MAKTDGNYADYADYADFQYDANGNRIAKAGNNYTTSYSYDYENRLTRIDEHNGKALEYAYDGDGNRISRSDLQPNPNGLEIAQYLYDINNSLPEDTEENAGLEVQNAEQPKDSEQPEEEITNKSYMDKVESTIRLLNTNADNRELVQEPKVPVMDVPFEVPTQQPQMQTPTLPENLKAEAVKPLTNKNEKGKELAKEPLIKIPTIPENIEPNRTKPNIDSTNNKLNNILNLTPKLPDNPLQDTVNPNLNIKLSQVIAVYNGKTGALDADYTYGLERISVHDEDTSTGKVQDPLYYLYDGIGRVTELTKPTAQVSDKYRFDPYGVELPGGKMSPNAYKNLNNPFGYNGEQYDPEAGLSYMRNRYYEPETGRFMNRDLLPGRVVEPLSMNAYAFVGNDPVQYVDPLGLEKGRYPIWQKSDENYSMTVQAILLQYNLDWYFADSQAEKDRLLQKANDLRYQVDSGLGAFLNGFKRITEAASDEYSIGSTSRYERDELLNLNQLFTPDMSINETQEYKNLRTGVFVAGFLTPSGEGELAVKGVRSLIKENKTLIKAAEKFDKSNALTKELNELTKKFIIGNVNPGIGTKHLFNGIYELRTSGGARLYYRMNDGVMEILAKSDKNTQNQVIETLRKMYGR